MKKLILAGLCGLILSIGTANAQVVVRIGPPAPIVERPGPPPRTGFVWVGGYHRWNGQRYVWVPGRWVRPPRPHAVWVPAHWVPRRGGYVFVRGHWR